MDIQELSAELAQKLARLESTPRDLALFRECVDLCMRVGEFNTAQALVDRSISHYPNELWIYIEKAKLQLVLGEYELSIDTLNHIQAEGLFTPDILYYLVWARLNLEEYERVVDEIESSSHFVREYPALILVKVRALHHLKKVAEAISELDHYLSIDSNNADAYALKSTLLLEQSNYFEAKQFADEAIALCPDNQEARQNIEKIRLSGYSTDESISFKGVEEATPCLIREHATRPGGTKLFAEQVLEVEEVIKSVRDTEPQDIGTWHALAWAKILHNKIDEAKYCFESARQLDEGFSESYGGLAVVAALEEDYSLANSLVNQAFRFDPNSASGGYAKDLVIEKLSAAKVETGGIKVEEIDNFEFESYDADETEKYTLH